MGYCSEDGFTGISKAHAERVRAVVASRVAVSGKSPKEIRQALRDWWTTATQAQKFDAVRDLLVALIPFYEHDED